jgi:hypothetical protein
MAQEAYGNGHLGIKNGEKRHKRQSQRQEGSGAWKQDKAKGWGYSGTCRRAFGTKKIFLPTVGTAKRSLLIRRAEEKKIKRCKTRTGLSLGFLLARAGIPHRTWRERLGRRGQYTITCPNDTPIYLSFSSALFCCGGIHRHVFKWGLSCVCFLKAAYGHMGHASTVVELNTFSC